MAFAAATCEVAYARKLAAELGFVQLTPTKIYKDSQGALVLANNTYLRNRSKHISLQLCFVQHLISLGIMDGAYNPSGQEHSDVGTKAVSETPCEYHTKHLLCVPEKKS